MNVLKNMEFVFLGAVLVAAGTNFAVAQSGPATRIAAKAAAPAQLPMATVIVVGKRLTPEQKAKLGN